MDKIQCCCPVESKTAADYLRECGCKDDENHFMIFKNTVYGLLLFIRYYIRENVLIIGPISINDVPGWITASTMTNICTAQQIKMALAIYGIDLERKKDIQ